MLAGLEPFMLASFHPLSNYHRHSHDRGENIQKINGVAICHLTLLVNIVFKCLSNTMKRRIRAQDCNTRQNGCG